MNQNRIKLVVKLITGLKVAAFLIFLLAIGKFAYNVLTIKAEVETVTKVTGQEIYFDGGDWFFKESTREFASDEHLQFHCWTWSTSAPLGRQDPTDAVIVRDEGGKYWYLPKAAVTKAFYTRNGERIG